MQPEIQLGPLELKTFGLMFALGFLAAGALVARRFHELGKPVDWAYEMIFAGAGRRARRRARLLPGPELGRRQPRPVREPVLGIGTGLVRRRDRRRARRSACGRAGGGSGACGCSTWRRPAWRSATRSAGSAASSRATATTASRRTCRGRCRIRTGRCRRTRRCTRRRSTRRSRWAWWPGCCGRGATASGPGILFAVYLVLSGLERFLVEFVRRNDATVAGLTTPQVESLVLMAGRRGVDRGRQPPAGRAGAPAAT